MLTFVNPSLILYSFVFVLALWSWVNSRCVCVSVCVYVCVHILSHFWLSVTIRTVVQQAPLSMKLSRQEYCSGCHFVFQGIFPTQGWNLHLLHVLHWQVDIFLSSEPPGKPSSGLKLITELFTTTETWKQSQCLSMDEWVKKMWYLYRVVYYSAIKRRKSSYLWQHGWTVRALW